MYGNKEKKGLDKLEGKSKREVIGYVPFSFIAPPQKGFKRPIDISKGIRSLNHLI